MQSRYSLVAAIITGLLVCAVNSNADSSVHLQVAGHEISGPPAPYVKEGMLWGPVAAVAQCWGAQIDWQPSHDRLIVVMPDGHKFRFQAGQAFFEQDDVRLPLPAEVAIRDKQLVAPLPAILKAWGANLYWNTDKTRFEATVPLAEPVVRGDAEGLTIELETAALVSGQVHYLSNPYRAYVDILGAECHEAPGRRYLGQAGVWRLRWGQFSRQPAVARYVLDLQQLQPVTWRPAPDGRGGTLIVGRFDGDEPVVPVHYPKLRGAKISQTDDDSTVVAIELSLPAELDYDVLAQPWRIRIRLKDAWLEQKPLRQSVGGEIVEGLEVIPSTEGLTANVYLNQLISFDLTTVENGETWQVRLTFRKARLSEKVIMIDPGHGGEDTGARGQKLLEKDLNLDVATQVASILISEGVRTQMTRDSDVFVDLFERPRLAEQLGADAFVSIHCNAMPKPNTNWGTETYYYTPQSKMLAIILHQQLLKALGRKDNGVRRARFVVTREPKMPAVLVELMYLNHYEEEQLLTKLEVRQAAAEALVRGLRQYYEGELKPVQSQPVSAELIACGNDAKGE